MPRKKRASWNRGKRFVDLPRNKRADMVFDIKHRVEKGKFRNFDSYDFFGSGLSWGDVNFVGRDKFTFWNATVQTTAYHRADLIRSMAFDQTYDALTPEEHALRPKPIFEKVPGISGSRMVFGVEPRFDKFEGRNFNEQIRYLESVLEVEVHESIQIDRSYRFGIGLIATLDVPLLTVDIVEQFVDDFVRDDIEIKYETAPNWTSTIPANCVDAPVLWSTPIEV